MSSSATSSPFSSDWLFLARFIPRTYSPGVAYARLLLEVLEVLEALVVVEAVVAVEAVEAVELVAFIFCQHLSQSR